MTQQVQVPSIASVWSRNASSASGVHFGEFVAAKVQVLQPPQVGPWRQLCQVGVPDVQPPQRGVVQNGDRHHFHPGKSQAEGLQAQSAQKLDVLLHFSMISCQLALLTLERISNPSITTSHFQTISIRHSCRLEYESLYMKTEFAWFPALIVPSGVGVR